MKAWTRGGRGVADESPERPTHSLNSWKDLPVYEKPARLHFIANLAGLIVPFVIGAAIGGLLGFGLWYRGLEMVYPAWARSLVVGKLFVGGGALLGGLWLAAKRPTLR